MLRAAYVEPMDEPPAGSSPRSLSDGVLALRIALSPAGARDAEAELCRRFGPRIRLFGLRHLRDAAAAADLVQEVLLTVVTRLRARSLRDPHRVASFVLGACRLAVSERRNGTARRDALLARYGDDLAPAAPEPEASRVDVARLERCLAGLPPRERAVVQLTFYAERASEEIGRELELSPGNVRVVRHRALAHLRACMGGEVAP
jgi:RNA polymerase sigma-70 factor (ECF subfamily)